MILIHVGFLGFVKFSPSSPSVVRGESLVENSKARSRNTDICLAWLPSWIPYALWRERSCKADSLRCGSVIRQKSFIVSKFPTLSMWSRESRGRPGSVVFCGRCFGVIWSGKSPRFSPPAHHWQPSYSKKSFFPGMRYVERTVSSVKATTKVISMSLGFVWCRIRTIGQRPLVFLSQSGSRLSLWSTKRSPRLWLQWRQESI